MNKLTSEKKACLLLQKYDGLYPNTKEYLKDDRNYLAFNKSIQFKQI